MIIKINVGGIDYHLDVDRAIDKKVLTEDGDIPYTWEEYEETATDIQYLASDYNSTDALVYDIFRDSDTARAFYSLGKLKQLRDAWVGNKTECNCTLFIDTNNTIKISEAYGLLSFPTIDMASRFANAFEDLIIDAKIFLL